MCKKYFINIAIFIWQISILFSHYLVFLVSFSRAFFESPNSWNRIQNTSQENTLFLKNNRKKTNCRNNWNVHCTINNTKVHNNEDNKPGLGILNSFCLLKKAISKVRKKFHRLIVTSQIVLILNSFPVLCILLISTMLGPVTYSIGRYNLCWSNRKPVHTLNWDWFKGKQTSKSCLHYQ